MRCQYNFHREVAHRKVSRGSYCILTFRPDRHTVEVIYNNLSKGELQ
ncbi:hypothetical protein FHS18_002909 [Paenibacillus phyllosphaerae]|uniref:Uncharacterized protein n=1 Tax=Paenibacillus phyllosphaerae TaxID=274593 RepID=A0A7W5AY32_9BACL|nr:hypothetical protein [Paenibacillus phyllosphaerae]